MGKRGPKVDQFFQNFSGWTEPIHWVLDQNFRKFWLNASRPMVRSFPNQFPIILQETSWCAPKKELCQNSILYLRQVFDVYNFVLLEGTRQFFHHPNSIPLKLTNPSWIDKNYAWATRSNLPANRFHTETSSRFVFTWYCCEISYRSETSNRCERMTGMIRDDNRWLGMTDLTRDDYGWLEMTEEITTDDSGWQEW